MITDIELIPTTDVFKLLYPDNQSFMLTDPKIMECLLRIEAKLDELLGVK